MNNLLLKIIVTLLFLTKVSYGELINKIEISGNKRISNETILVLGEISKAKDFTSDNLNNSLKKLYDTNFFKDINISLNNGLLKIIVDENPIIEDIEILGIKSKTFKEELYKEIGLKNRMSFTEGQLKNDINLIKNILKTNGFYFATVKPSLVKNDELNSIRLKLEIDRGEKARIKEIQFIGDKRLKTKNY